LRVYHGLAYRPIVNFAHSERANFVIAGGNSGRVGSKHITDYYDKWLNGEHYEVHFGRDQLPIESVWQFR